MPAAEPPSQQHQTASPSSQQHRETILGQHAGHNSLNTAQFAAAVEPIAALHVRGKSSLKHTKQLLDCWLKHPEWPQLTVLGPMPNEQITLEDTRRYLAAGNIVAPRPGKLAGDCVEHIAHQFQDRRQPPVM